MYEDFGKKKNKLFHNFPVGNYSLHFDPKDFQDFVCKNLKINFNEIDENVKDYKQIDSDYIIDCRGSPKTLKGYEELVSPVNCALLSTLPKKENDVEYTRSIAHENGWCFYIPLPDKTSLGYIFNKSITKRHNFNYRFSCFFLLRSRFRCFFSRWTNYMFITWFG